jgi:hypothetical protein
LFFKDIFYRPKKGVEEVKRIEHFPRLGRVRPEHLSYTGSELAVFSKMLMSLQKSSCQMNLEKEMQLYQNHAELAYILEMPKEPGEAQNELGIEKEASYVLLLLDFSL